MYIQSSSSAMEVLFHASHIALHISIFKHKIRTLVSTKYHNSTCRGIHNIVSISTHIHLHTVHKQCTHCTQTAAITLEPLHTQNEERVNVQVNHTMDKFKRNPCVIGQQQWNYGQRAQIQRQKSTPMCTHTT